jgi:hypothetical protein
MANYLFQGTFVHDFIHGIQARAANELKTLGENSILATPTDDLVAANLSAHSVQIPELRDSETELEDGEVTSQEPNRGYDFSTDTYGGTGTVKRHLVSFHVPFEGDGSLFTIKPSSGSVPGPNADVRGQELIINFLITGKTESQVRQEFENQIRSIKQHLSTLKNDLRNVTSEIETSGRTYIERRKAELLKSKNLVAALGFPMQRRAGAPMT